MVIQGHLPVQTTIADPHIVLQAKIHPIVVTTITEVLIANHPPVHGAVATVEASKDLQEAIHQEVVFPPVQDPGPFQVVPQQAGPFPVVAVPGVEGDDKKLLSGFHKNF